MNNEAESDEFWEMFLIMPLVRLLHHNPLTEVASQRLEQVETNPERQISECIDVVNFMLSLARCPGQHRSYIDAALGTVHEKIEVGLELFEFEADDFDIGKRIRGDSAEGLSKGAIKKTAQRARKEFDLWQKKASYRFIEAENGGKKNNQFFKTKYRVPLLAAAAEALIEAREGRLWRRDPSKAVKQAAKVALNSLRGQLIKRDRFNRPRQDDEAIINRNHRTILTKAEKNAAIVERNGGTRREYLERLAEELLEIALQEPGAAENEAENGFVHTNGNHEYGQNANDDYFDR